MDTGGQPIDLARLDDALFDRLYKERIEPCFASNEEGRLGAVKQFKQRLLIGGGVVLAILVIVGAWTGDASAGLVFAFMAAIGAGVIAYQPLAKIGRKLKHEYCTAIAEAMGANVPRRRVRSARVRAAEGLTPCSELRALELRRSVQRHA